MYTIDVHPVVAVVCRVCNSTNSFSTSRLQLYRHHKQKEREKKKLGRMQDSYNYISFGDRGKHRKAKVTPLLEQRRKQRKSLTNTCMITSTTLYSYTIYFPKPCFFSYPVAAYAASPGLGSASIPLACIFAAEHLLIVGELLEIASVK